MFVENDTNLLWECKLCREDTSVSAASKWNTASSNSFINLYFISVQYPNLPLCTLPPRATPHTPSCIYIHKTKTMGHSLIHPFHFPSVPFLSPRQIAASIPPNSFLSLCRPLLIPLSFPSFSVHLFTIVRYSHCDLMMFGSIGGMSQLSYSYGYSNNPPYDQPTNIHWQAQW